MSAAAPISEALRTQIDQLTDECRAAYHEIDAAIESGEKQRQLDAGQAIENIAQRYRELRAANPAEDKAIERALDRRIVDLRRSASSLVQRVGGARAERARDFGSVPFLEQRSPSSGPAPAEWPTLAPKRVGVGTEIESWCGKCKDMRAHSIVAMVGDQPKQVICTACRSTHNHRAEPPARSRTAAEPEAAPAQRERSRREEIRRDLQRELNASIAVRNFDPKATYKRGEIIAHPTHGRGKIENVLKGSLLVRFLEGLRPVDLA